jgi:hypothetical protein
MSAIIKIITVKITNKGGGVKNDKIIVLKYLAMKIEIHWRFINFYRNMGVKLINRGSPLSSKKLLWYDRRLQRVNKLVQNWQKQYREICEDKAIN